MKKFFFTLVIAVSAVVNANAMSSTRSSAEARFLTDKMAWELSLNEYQIENIYEINYDYFRSLVNVYDNNRLAYDIRNEEIHFALSPAQWALYMSIEYFLTPVRIVNNAWFFPIHNHYAHNHFYYDAPRGYHHYNGGHVPHGNIHNGHNAHNGHNGMNQHRPQMGHNNNAGPQHHNNGQMHNGQHNNGQKHGNGQMHQNHQRPQNGMNNSNRGNGGGTRSNNGNMANGAHRGARR